MTVDHKAIREALQHANGDWYERNEWLRQLLDENQRLDDRMLENHRRAVANAVIIDELRDENQAQAQEIEQLQADKAVAVETLEWSVERIEQLEKALGFYADTNNWLMDAEGFIDLSICEFDSGQIARQALKGGESE